MVALSVSAAGLVAYRTGSASGRRQFVWFDRSGKQIERVGASGFSLNPSLSRDGRYVALTRDVDGTDQIWLLDTGRGEFRQLTSGGGFPVWST
jgi:Tol biopolymer transport system component